MKVMEPKFENRDGEYVDLQNGICIYTVPAADLKDNIRSTVDSSHFASRHMIIKDIIQIVKPEYHDNRTVPVRSCGISLIIRCGETLCTDGALISFTNLTQLNKQCGILSFLFELQQFRRTKRSKHFSEFILEIEQIVSDLIERPSATPIQVKFKNPYHLNGQGQNDRFLQSWNFTIEGLLIEP